MPKKEKSADGTAIPTTDSKDITNITNLIISFLTQKIKIKE